MRDIVLIVLIFLNSSFVNGVEISISINLRDDSSTPLSTSSSCESEYEITSTDIEELKDQLSEKLEELMSLNQLELNVVISTNINTGIGTHFTPTTEVLDTTSSIVTPIVSATSTRSNEEVSTSKSNMTSEVTDANASFPSTSCELQFNGTSYWGRILEHWINFTEAQQYCKGRNSNLPTFPNNETFQNVTEYFRYKIPPPERNHYAFWIGLEINPINYDVPKNTYIQWKNNLSTPPNSYTVWTNVIVLVYHSQLIESAMSNRPPNHRMYGIVCSYPN
uniref:uncharacterized protein LOC120332922 n=1 Tax=Styela clava TaxID=7725 RepID=UPI00193A7679|nr:uncharacterized protein LOC120332922 [Styela clava]